MKFIIYLLVSAFVVSILVYFFILISTRKNIKWFNTPSSEGKFADAHGNKIYYRVKGKGEPVVVVITDIGSSQAEWWPIQNEVGSKYRMITWDRAGYGWSTADKSPRTAAIISDELDMVLKFERIKKPIFLVAHGVGTIYARYYAATHPKNIIGALLINPLLLQYSQWLNTINETEECLNIYESTQKKKKYAGKGIYRVFSPIKGYKLDRRYKRDIIEHYSRTENYDTMELELSELQSTFSEIEAAGTFPSIPLKVLHPANESLIREWVRNGTPEYSARQLGRLHQELSRDILNLSPKATLHEIKDSGEYIHLSKPDIVVKEIINMMGG